MSEIPWGKDQMIETGTYNTPGLVLVAAGKGCRFGGNVPKQFLLLDEKPVYLSSLRKFVPFTNRITVVVPDNWVKQVCDQLIRFREESAQHACIQVIAGGSTRQESVLKGLQSLRGQCSHVLVHDAVRPFVSRALIARVISGMFEHGAAIPMEPVTDTVKVVKGNMVVETLDRSVLRQAQTPQGSEFRQLLDASEKAAADGFMGTDESSILERLDLPVFVVEGEKSNIKITWKEDLDRRDMDET